jgi:hypothetical protein
MKQKEAKEKERSTEEKPEEKNNREKIEGAIFKIKDARLDRFRTPETMR